MNLAGTLAAALASRSTRSGGCRRWACCLVVLVVGAAAAAGQRLDVDEVLFRASQAILDFEKVFSNVVTEEMYGQRVVDPSGKVRRERKLVSDFLLVRPPGADSWFGFRDVLQVDGKQVRDRQKRLSRLFLESPDDALEQAARVAKESARYNIGGISRNINLPTMALAILHPMNQYRFYFEKAGEETVEGTMAWVIRFVEHRRPTLVRAGRGDVFARGTVWVDPEGGHLLRSELFVGDANSPVRSRSMVEYRLDEEMGFWLPTRMEEVYDRPGRTRSPVIEGVADYSNFRRFEVQVDEIIEVPR